MQDDPNTLESNAIGSFHEESPPIRRVAVFIIVICALLVSSIDSTIVATALHALQRALNTTVDRAGWTITAYSFGIVLMLPISGILSERYGNRRVFLCSVAVFTVASLLCGLCDNIYALIAFRAVQAAGGAGFTPAATGIIVNHFGDSRDRALGLFGSAFSVGSMTGPIFGGFFVEYWDWRGIFFVNVPIGLLIVGAGLYFIPRDLPKATRSRSIDPVGGIQLGTGLLAGMLAANSLSGQDWRLWSPSFALPMIVSIVSLGLFFRRIRCQPEPFIVPHFIYGSGFRAINVLNVLYGVTSGAVALVPLYAINRYGIGALGAATLLIAQGGASIVFSIAASMVLRLTGYRLPLYVGGGIIATGAILLALPPIGDPSPNVWLAAGTFLIGVGNGIVNPAGRNAGLMLAPANSSTLAALRTMCRQIGTITCVSIATAIIAGSAAPGDAQAWVYVAAAGLLIIAMPLVARVPENRGAW